MGRVLGVEIVVLSSPPSILLVGGRDLEDHDLCLLHKAQEPCAVAAGRTRFRCAEAHRRRASRRAARRVALPGRGEGSCSEDPILASSTNRCDVKILMGIDAADNVSLSPFDDLRHSQLPDLPCAPQLASPGPECAADMTGHETMEVRPFSGHHRHRRGKALTARRSPGGRQVRGKTRPGRSGVWVRPHQAPHGASLPNGPSL